jgi:hypothetical protein
VCDGTRPAHETEHGNVREEAGRVTHRSTHTDEFQLLRNDTRERSMQNRNAAERLILGKRSDGGRAGTQPIARHLAGHSGPQTLGASIDGLPISLHAGNEAHTDMCHDSDTIRTFGLMS